MYTGLVIEELFALVERAEERTRRSRQGLDSPALKPELQMQSGWKFPQESMLLAGVA